MATSNIQIFKRTGFKYVNDSSATEGSVFWDNPVIASYVSRWINGDNNKIQTKAPGNTTRGDSPLIEAMDIDWRPYKILTQRPGNINGYQYLATTTDLLMSLNANYVELKDAVSNAQTSANTISYSLSTTGKVVTLNGSNPSTSVTFGGDNWINIAGPANATLTGELTFTHGTPNIANNTGTTKGGGTSEIITKITYDSKGHIADVVKGTLTTEKLETDGNGKVVKQVVLDGYKLKVAYTNTITNATNATNATNVDLSLTYDTSTGIKVQAGSGTAGTLKATLAQGSDHDKVKLQLGGSDAGSEVTINDVAHATSADSVAITASYVAGTSGAGKGLSIQGGSGTADVVPFKLATSGSGSSAKIGLRIDGQTAGSDITVPFATEATKLTNKPSLSYDGGLKVTAGGKTSDPLQIKLLQGSSDDKVKLKIGSTDTGEVTINNVGAAKFASSAGKSDTILIKDLNSNSYLLLTDDYTSNNYTTPTPTYKEGRAIYTDNGLTELIIDNIQLTLKDTIIWSTNGNGIGMSGGNTTTFWNTNGTSTSIGITYWKDGNVTHTGSNYKTTTTQPNFTTDNTYVNWARRAVNVSGVTVANDTSNPTKLKVTIGDKNDSVVVNYATTAGSATTATNATNAEKVLINADQYDTLTPGTVEDAVIKLAEQDDPAPMEQLRAANFGITPVVFAANEKSSKYMFESGANNSLWSNPLTSQESLTNNGPFILHNNGKPDILYSQVIGVNKIYGKEFTGNAATATSATTAAGFTGTVSLQNASNQLKVTVGSTTSSGLTIAYATNAGNADTVDGYHIVNGTGTNANTIYIVT